MSDAWLDLLRLAVMGAVGLGGAWLGAQATRRKDPQSQVWLKETTERAAADMTELQRASAIAIVLGDDVRLALDELEAQWQNATRQNTGHGEAAERYAAVQKTRHTVEAIAKRHLRL